jgi:hypothetical protein
MRATRIPWIPLAIAVAIAVFGSILAVSRAMAA